MDHGRWKMEYGIWQMAQGIEAGRWKWMPGSAIMQRQDNGNLTLGPNTPLRARGTVAENDGDDLQIHIFIFIKYMAGVSYMIVLMIIRLYT